MNLRRKVRIAAMRLGYRLQGRDLQNCGRTFRFGVALNEWGCHYRTLPNIVRGRR